MSNYLIDNLDLTGVRNVLQNKNKTMRIVETVKTEKQARHLLRGVLRIEKGSCQCECGETPALIAIGKGYDTLGKIGICEACGDDDKPFSEVFYS